MHLSHSSLLLFSPLALTPSLSHTHTSPFFSPPYRYAPYEDGMPLLNFSTFSTNVTLVEESDLERAIESFDINVVDDSGPLLDGAAAVS